MFGRSFLNACVAGTLTLVLMIVGITGIMYMATGVDPSHLTKEIWLLIVAISLPTAIIVAAMVGISTLVRRAVAGVKNFVRAIVTLVCT